MLQRIQSAIVNYSHQIMGNIRVLKYGKEAQVYQPSTQEAEAKGHEFKANFTVRIYSEARACCEQGSKSTCKLAVWRGQILGQWRHAIQVVRHLDFLSKLAKYVSSDM